MTLGLVEQCIARRPKTRARSKIERDAASAEEKQLKLEQQCVPAAVDPVPAAATAATAETEVDTDIPTLVNDKWKVQRDVHLGSGHYGCVYQGHNVYTGEAVAIKMSKTRISSKEIRALVQMNGDGAPKLHFHGEQGDYHIIVMEKLGQSLYHVIEKRSLNKKRGRWVLSRKEGRDVGMRCLVLLQRLHSLGIVHADVKPANFVCSSGSVFSAGISLIDFGLSRPWRVDNDTHVEYWQHLTHFAGSLRYASIHAHLGRGLTRRDDLESLGYMILYLMLGALPWQGFRGNDKSKLICLSKGAVSLTDLCKDVPPGLMYYLAYVRQLKYDQEPDYAYLRDCLDFGKLNFGKLTSESGVNPMHQLTVSATEPRVGRKRVTPSSDPCDENQPVLKKHRVILPVTRKVLQWIVTSSQGYPKLAQRMVSANSMTALIKEVNRMAEEYVDTPRFRWAVQSLSAGEGTYRAVLSCGEFGIKKQKLVHTSTDAEFLDMVQELSAMGYCITHAMGTPLGWVVCATTYEVEPFENQRFGVSETFPSSWVDENWEDGYQITDVAAMATKWVVIMSRGSGAAHDDQVVELSFGYPSESIRARWRDGYAITASACTVEQSAYVMSRSCAGEEIIQRCTRTSHNPALKLKVESRQDFSIDCIAFGRVE